MIDFSFFISPRVSLPDNSWLASWLNLRACAIAVPSWWSCRRSLWPASVSLQWFPVSRNAWSTHTYTKERKRNSRCQTLRKKPEEKLFWGPQRRNNSNSHRAKYSNFKTIRKSEVALWAFLKNVIKLLSYINN